MSRPAISHEWLAGRFPLSVYVVDPTPHRPHALMLFDPGAAPRRETIATEKESDGGAGKTRKAAALV